MSAEDVVEGHPLKMLDEKTCLPENGMGLIIARPGVGKSAVLINFALEELIQGRQVLHFCADMTSEKAHQYYREIFEEMKRTYGDAISGTTWDDVYHNFIVISYMDPHKMVNDLEAEIQTILSSADFNPSLVAVDGLDLNGVTEQALGTLKQAAQNKRVKLLASMVIHRNAHGDVDLDSPIQAAHDHTDHIYYLEPASRDRVNFDFMSVNGPAKLPVYLCPHDFIFKVA